MSAVFNSLRPHSGFEFSASVICFNQLKLGEIISELRTLGVKRIHIDLIDNAFSGLGLPKEILTDIRARFSMPVDVHFMVTNPESLVEFALSQKVNCVAVHQSALTNRLVASLHAASQVGTEVSLVLGPGEAPSEESIKKTGAKRLTAMSVMPGAAGRPFEPRVFDTLRQAARIKARGLIQRIEVDGAVGPQTLPMMSRAGADIGVVGSTVFPNRDTVGNHLQELLKGMMENGQSAGMI